jgi:NADH:ubiquinone reductase (H+-translocating)
VPGIPNVFVIGDAAHFSHDLPAPLPGVAQVAMQQGRFVAKQIVLKQRVANSESFTYRDYGTMATIGRARAIADIFGIRLKGLTAWVAWAGLHILQLISFRNRLKVMIEWLWYYISFQPGARLLIKRTSKHE